jgi:hypothetical protein
VLVDNGTVVLSGLSAGRVQSLSDSGFARRPGEGHAMAVRGLNGKDYLLAAACGGAETVPAAAGTWEDVVTGEGVEIGAGGLSLGADEVRLLARKDGR